MGGLQRRLYAFCLYPGAEPPVLLDKLLQPAMIPEHIEGAMPFSWPDEEAAHLVMRIPGAVAVTGFRRSQRDPGEAVDLAAEVVRLPVEPDRIANFQRSLFFLGHRPEAPAYLRQVHSLPEVVVEDLFHHHPLRTPQSLLVTSAYVRRSTSPGYALPPGR